MTGIPASPTAGPNVTLVHPQTMRLIRSAEGVGLVATARQGPPPFESLTLTEGAIVASGLDRHRRLAGLPRNDGARNSAAGWV